MIELHCEICANAGGMTRISPDTLIAKFEPEDVKLPLDGGMFKSSMPDRGVPPPWHPGTTWDFMHCPRARRHLPWMGVGDESTLAKMQNAGGPEHLLTNRGNLAVGEDGLEEEQYRHQDSEEDLEQEWNERVGMEGNEDARMKEMREQGYSYNAIAKIFDKSTRTVRRRILGER